MRLNKAWDYKVLSNKGIFNALGMLTFPAGERPEWLTAEAVRSLDREYHLNRSGQKESAPIIDALIIDHPVNKYLTETDKNALANIIYNKYQDKWARYWRIVKIEYNPIENYSMIETETPDISHKHKVSPDFKLTQSQSVESDITTTDTTQNQNSVYGYNNALPVPSADTEVETQSHTLAAPESNKTVNESEQTGYTEDTETGTRELTRSGNIGVTTSQQMAQSEIDLWRDYNFYNAVMLDIDRVLTLLVYNFD